VNLLDEAIESTHQDLMEDNIVTKYWLKAIPVIELPVGVHAKSNGFC
jgi:hypothetical protein